MTDFLWFALRLAGTTFALVYPRGLKPVYTSQSKLFHVGEERLSSCLSRMREAGHARPLMKRGTRPPRTVDAIQV